MKNHENLREMVEARMAIARRIVESGRDVMPVALLIKPDGAIDIIGIVGGEESKAETMVVLVNLALDKKATVVLIVDANTTSTKTGEQQEAIIASVFGPGQTTEMAIWRYKRDPFQWEDVSWGQGAGLMAPDLKGEERVH